MEHPEINKQFVLYTDTSKFAVGAVLLQQEDTRVERATSFYLTKLSSAQQNYSTFERPCLAVVSALEHFRVYLLSRPFRLRTDHKALSWRFAEPKASARVAGWIATLLEYRVSIEYMHGSENAIADILSRLNGHDVNEELPSGLARGVPSFVCPISDVDRFAVRID